MPKRLAITISGAVSLGSYEAGVLYEVIHAIGQHNQNAKTTEDERIVIDVITGASAGGMTATILAQKLAFEASSLEGAYSNSLYRPWVEEVSLEGLLNTQPGEDPTHSFLSSNFVHDIARKYLTRRYQTHMDPVPVAHPAAKQTIRLGLALSNLNGLDYGIPVRPANADGTLNKFIYTRHQDELETWVETDKPAVDDIEGFWEPLRLAAVSCGAFPFAFRVVDLIRTREEYTETGKYVSAKPNLVTALNPLETFTYTDGGTFQNEPLGLAKNLVNKEDAHRDVDSRFYLYISPSSKGSAANRGFHESTANFAATAYRAIGAIFQQAQFQDWITAEKINDQVALLNARAMQLHQALKGSSAAAKKKAATLQSAASQLLPELFVGSKETLAAARARLTHQFQKEYNGLPPSSRGPWIDSILTLETVASLGSKEEMKIYTVTAKSSELASGEFLAFAGFFERRLREHDYDIGREKAQAFLLSPELSKPGELGPIRFTPEALRKHPNLGGITIGDIDRSARENFRDRILDRTDDILKELGIEGISNGGAFVRNAIKNFFIRPRLNKLLAL